MGRLENSGAPFRARGLRARVRGIGEASRAISG